MTRGSERAVITKGVSVAVREAKKRMGWLEYHKKKLPKTNEKPVRRYGEQETLAGRGVENLMKIISLYFVGVGNVCGQCSLTWRLGKISI